MKCSIIIATRNRADALRDTLASFHDLRLPDGLEAEIVVVDNGSSDHTASVVQAAALESFSVRYLFETIQGKSYAQNHALRETSGEFLLFTDDDVRLPPYWLEEMIATLVQYQPCAVAGGVRLASHLLRPWMTPLHRSWLASTEWLDSHHPRGMVGANMGFSRAVLDRVPEFDPELGPGALGLGEEQLFASQLLEAGFRIICRNDVTVEHHFEPARLRRSAWIDAAVKRGRSHAYRGHHWEHWSSRLVPPRLFTATARLAIWNLRHRHESPAAEGCTREEMLLHYNCALLRAHLAEKSRVRNYDRRGLARRGTTAFRPAPAIPGVASCDAA